MSLFGLRLLATVVTLWVIAIAASPVVVAALPDSTWVPIAALTKQPLSALFALAVSPSNNQLLISGDSQGSLFRSTNGGATWAATHAGRAAITTVVFSPSASGVVLSGTRGSGP